MNKLYVIGAVFMGVGAMFMFHAGEVSALQEVKDRQNEVWERSFASDTPVGTVDHVREQRDGNDSSRAAAPQDRMV